MKKIILSLIFLFPLFLFAQIIRTLNGQYNDGQTFGKPVRDTIRTLIADGVTTTISSGGTSFIDTIKSISTGGGTPASSNQTVQFNNSGVFGGDSANFTYGKTGHTLLVTGSITTPILYGSTASGGSLTIRSTVHATKGFVYFGIGNGVAYDETNTRLGIGTYTPAFDLDILHSVNGIARGVITNLNAGSAAQAYWELKSSTTTTLIMGGTGSKFTPSGSDILGETFFQSTGTQSLFRNTSGSWVWVTKPASTDIERWRIDFTTGNFSNTGSAGTAFIHLKAGTATAGTAPFKLMSGTNLTTAEAGAMEYNGTNLFFTPSSAVRNNILMTSSVNTVSPTSPDRTITVVINGTTYYIAAKTSND